MAQSVVASVECHHKCASMLPIISLTTTSVTSAPSTLMPMMTSIGSTASSSSSSSLISSLTKLPLNLVTEPTNGIGTGSLNVPANAIVTITSVPVTAPVVSVATPVTTEALVIPNITIATISQTTNSGTLLTARTEPQSSKMEPSPANITIRRAEGPPPPPLLVLPALSNSREQQLLPISTAKVQETSSCTIDGNHLIGGPPSAEISNIIVVETNVNKDGSSEPISTDFDPVKDLEWNNGVTTLPGSNLRFRYNEFGVMELITENEPMDASDWITSSSTVSSSSNATNTPSKIGNVGDKKKKQTLADGSDKKRSLSVVSDDSRKEPMSPHDSSETNALQGAQCSRCRVCGHYGRTSTFFKSSMFCSPECLNSYSEKNLAKKDHDLLDSRKTHVSSDDEDDEEQEEEEEEEEEEEDDNEEEEEVEKNSPVPIPAPAPVQKHEKRGRPPGSKKSSNLKKYKGVFTWPTYLEYCKAIAAPSKLFRDPFPSTKNGFRVGMKLEGIDPVHPSLFCIMTVAEVRGFRIRLHFDGYSEYYDFWVNADSTDIFPVGWCEKTGHKLQPPLGYSKQTFNWSNYLRLSNAQSTPKSLFANKASTSITPCAFRCGMKLEAVDKKTLVDYNPSSLVCVATITDVMDSRILVHFDGWDTIYDYWADSTSPYIHPVGWCQETGHVLTPPNNCKDPEHFTWEAYLAKTKSLAAPARAFKQRPTNGFKKGMKLETVDFRNPSLIRVATVTDVKNHQIKVHFDGWADVYDTWVDDDSADIHPINWCERTGHPLEPPPPINDSRSVSNQGYCPTPGCHGVGHIRGPKYTSHHSAFGCPYSQGNLFKDLGIPDRLQSGKEQSTDLKRTSIEHSCPTPGCDGLGHINGKYTSHNKLINCPLAERNRLLKTENGDNDGVKQSTGRGRPKHKISSEDHNYRAKKPRLSRDASTDSSCSSLKYDSQSSTNSSSSSLAIATSKSSSLNASTHSFAAASIQASVHRSVFMPPSHPSQQGSYDLPISIRRHSKLLPGITRVGGSDINSWTVEQVTDFVRSLPGCQDVAKAFKDEQIDGEAFLLLTQSDIVKLMNIKLGPALKIYNSIMLFHIMVEA